MEILLAAIGFSIWLIPGGIALAIFHNLPGNGPTPEQTGALLILCLLFGPFMAGMAWYFKVLEKKGEHNAN